VKIGQFSQTLKEGGQHKQQDDLTRLLHGKVEQKDIATGIHRPSSQINKSKHCLFFKTGTLLYELENFTV
jgi:hypothetical protein